MTELQQKIEKYLKLRKWEKNEPVDLSKSIMIEGAELLELFQWKSPKRTAILKDKELLKNLEGELADILIYCFGMAISLNLDIEEVLDKKLAHLDKKYPPELLKKGQSEYLKRKQEYRRKR